MAPNLTKVNPQMEKLASNAVNAARDKFGLNLDYSEGSLMRLEDLLQKAHEGYRDGYQKSLVSGDSINVTLEYTVRIWGSYFGEVVRRSLGGDWVVDQKEVYLKFAPGRLDSLGEGSSRVLIVDHKNVFLQVESRRLDPLGQVRARIIGGPLYNLPDFFASIRNRLQKK